jgi:hypothetical protein
MVAILLDSFMVTILVPLSETSRKSEQHKEQMMSAPKITENYVATKY